MRIGDAVVIDVRGLDSLIKVLGELGYDTSGPVVREGAIMPGQVTGVGDLPVGYHDEQAPGRYRISQAEDETVFGWAVGPGSWKAELFPASQELWRATVGDDEVAFTEPEVRSVPLAIVGARPCEVAALGILDRVLSESAVPDPRYDARRRGAFVVAAECGTPASTCFCTSFGTGPGADGGFDLALSELDDVDGHRFIVRVGTDRGADALSRVPTSRAKVADLESREQMLAVAEAAIRRKLPDGVPALLGRNLEHPRWEEVAERCLSCGNCTLVCPTCFCSDVRDTTTLTGEVRRERTWASCFDLDHSYLHGGPVRASASSRYRQWLTHKLSTWWDQFGTSGCVGCGRCIAWCPVGIDITEEASAIASSDGAGRTSTSSTETA